MSALKTSNLDTSSTNIVHKKVTVAVLVDLPAGLHAGGQVKMWEHIATATTKSALPIEMTVFFSGLPAIEQYSEHVHAVFVPPIFSTNRLKFLPYLPDHTDLAGYNRHLAQQIMNFDIVHTTDGFFAFTRTAEKLHKRQHFALVHSFHTDQPAYAEIFTARSIIFYFGQGWAKAVLIDWFKLPKLASWLMRKRLVKHLKCCDHALAIRPEDRNIAETQIGVSRVSHLRMGVDRAIFRSDPQQRQLVCKRYGISPTEFLVLFVGRLDEGKNIYPLLDACYSLRASGHQIHLLAVGLGPAAADVQRLLGDHATLCGFLLPNELAKLYAGADILAIPSEVEIGSLVLVEALASGLPVLVSEASHLATLHGPSIALKPVAAGSLTWVEALKQVMLNPDLLEGMRHAAQDYGKTRIADWSTILQEDLFPAWQQALRMRV